MAGATGLRSLLKGEAMVIAPGAYDGLTAMLVAQAGFPAVYMTGAGTSVSHGYPDFGLLTMSEMVENAARIVRSVDVPVIADADTGYGNELNVFRTVQEYERRGVAGIHIEDQVSPKKCGHLDDKEIVPREDYVAKIRAAVAAKRDADFMIIARTDARAVAGLDEAVARANAALAAGADMAFVEAPQTMEELAAVPKLVRGPCLLNVVRGGKTPEIDLLRAQEMGYRLAIVPGLLLKAVIGACDEVLAALKAHHIHPVPRTDITVREAFNRVGAEEWDLLRTRFRDEAEPLARRLAS
jgi:2-methylisocitrate lyase-like PEP mutase family enzyme